MGEALGLRFMQSSGRHPACLIRWWSHDSGDPSANAGCVLHRRGGAQRQAFAGRNRRAKGSLPPAGSVPGRNRAMLAGWRSGRALITCGRSISGRPCQAGAGDVPVRAGNANGAMSGMLWLAYAGLARSFCPTLQTPQRHDEPPRRIYQ